MYTPPLATASSSQDIETSYQMDHNTLMFIAQGGMSRPMANPRQKLFKLVAPRPCYGCGGDHWFRDCLIKKDRALSIPPIKRFCTNCGIKHFIQDCPWNHELMVKTSLNYVEIIQSPRRLWARVRFLYLGEIQNACLSTREIGKLPDKIMLFSSSLLRGCMLRQIVAKWWCR